MYLERAVPHEARDAYRKDALSGVLCGVFNGGILPFMMVLARDRLHATELHLGLMAASGAVGCIFSLFYAHIMEGRRKMPFVVWPGVIGRGLFLLAPLAVTSMKYTLIVFLGLAIQSIIGPGYAAVLKEIYPDSDRGRIMAYIRVGAAFTTLVATSVAGFLMKGGTIAFGSLHIPSVDFRVLFPIAGLMGAASSFTFGTIRTAYVDPTHPDNQRPSPIAYLSGTLRILREDSGYRWFLIAIFVSGFGNLIAIPFYPILQVDVLHITSTWVAVLANTATIFLMMSYFYWGKTIDARCPLHATMVNVLINALIQVNYFLATQVWMLLPAAVLSGIVASGTELSYFNSILHFAKDGRETQYQALHSFLLGIRGVIAPLLAPVFTYMGVGVRTVFVISTVLMVIGALMQYQSMKSDRVSAAA